MVQSNWVRKRKRERERARERASSGRNENGLIDKKQSQKQKY